MHDTPTFGRVPQTHQQPRKHALMGFYGKRQRRKNNEPPLRRNGRILIQARIDPDLHAKAARAAEQLDISMAVYVAELIDRDQTDAEGCPNWTPRLVERSGAGQPRLDLSA